MKRRSAYSTNPEAVLFGPALILAILLVIVGFFSQNARAAETTDFDWQATFATPAEAGQALLAANQANDTDALARILGPESPAVLSSGDPVEDSDSRESFVAKFQKMNRWVTMTDGSQVLYIGADNYPFPIPLVKLSDSGWYFDTSAGEEEIVTRRIGRNELLAMDACAAIAKAQQLYFQTTHDGDSAREYAGRIISTPGKQDGLYWPVSGSKGTSPLNGLEDIAKDAIASAKSGNPPVIDGYVFRILTAQGERATGGAMSYLADGKLTRGFAVVASPVKYGDSGVMTFLMGRDGQLYQKDLGEDTGDVAAAMTDYNPGDGWTPAQ